MLKLLLISDEQKILSALTAVKSSELDVIVLKGDASVRQFAEREHLDGVVVDTSCVEKSWVQALIRFRNEERPTLPITYIFRAADVVEADWEFRDCDAALISPFTTKTLSKILSSVDTRFVKPLEDLADKLVLNEKRNVVKAGDHEIELTISEYRLLRIITEHEGEIVSYGKLKEAVSSKRAISDAGLRNHLSQLRHKIPALKMMLHTVPMLGIVYLPVF